MELSRVSEAFADAVGGLRNSRYLDEIVSPEDREKVMGLKSSILAEQKHLEPNYLPPILGRGDQILQSLGFADPDVARFRLNRQDYLTFISPDGQPRPYTVRLGLAKEGSFFFIALALHQHPRHAFPSSSPRDRNVLPSVFPRASAPSSGIPQHSSGALAADISRHRVAESAYPPGRHTMEALSATYPAQPQIGHPTYSGTALHQAPRSDAETESHAGRVTYQLPPIRVPAEREPVRGGRAGRVDIGGLIEKPEGPSRPH